MSDIESIDGNDEQKSGTIAVNTGSNAMISTTHDPVLTAISEVAEWYSRRFKLGGAE